MASVDLLRSFGLEEIYRSPTDDPPFDAVLRRVAIDVSDDSVLAELIEADGRSRLRFERAVGLERYLSALPDLERRPEPLDAAIEMALRCMIRSGSPDEDPLDALIHSHPHLERAIREADALGNALWSTMRLERALAARGPERQVPADFGPPMESGRARFELQRLVGEGAFGQVYLAIDRQLSEEDHPALVAIKILAGHPRSALERARLIEEATKARRIDHPNVVRVLDRGVADRGEEFIVYEFMMGGDLGRLVRAHRGLLPLPKAASIAARIARGVHAAHMAGLVHCDLKPSNIMLSAGGEPKVADFGIAIRTSAVDGATDASMATRPLGNLAFISPEQYRMAPGALTVPSDIYALGGLLFWLLTRELPNGSSIEEIRRAHDEQHGRQVPISPQALRPEVDRDLEAICRRCLALRPADRYASAAAVADDLDAWQRHEPIPWTKPGIVRRMRLWARRKPPLAAALAGLVLLLALGSVALTNWAQELSKRRDEEAHRLALAQVVDEWMESLNQSMVAGAHTDLFPQIWMMEWTLKPQVMAQGLDWARVYEKRVEILSDLIRRRRARGWVNDVQTLMWESALGFWLISESRYREADETLEGNAQRWRQLSPDDPWLRELDLMSAAARVGLASEVPLLDAAARSRLEQERPILESARQRLALDDPKAPLRYMTLRALILLEGPDLLNDASRLEAVNAELAELEGSDEEESEEEGPS